jgi:hypothetical protein
LPAIGAPKRTGRQIGGSNQEGNAGKDSVRLKRLSVELASERDEGSAYTNFIMPEELAISPPIMFGDVGS